MILIVGYYYFSVETIARCYNFFHTCEHIFATPNLIEVW